MVFNFNSFVKKHFSALLNLYLVILFKIAKFMLKFGFLSKFGVFKGVFEIFKIFSLCAVCA